jgi:hypothetical protein
MIRSVVSKLMWVGRATVFMVGLAVILALMFGVGSMAFAANGQSWILGQPNVATAITSLGGAGGVNGPMVRITNNDADANDTALDLRVQAGEAPMRVNSATKVASLNADRLDGLDSGAFGLKLVKSDMQGTHLCDTVDTWNECAQIQVTVPPGKTYEALITAEATFYEFASGENRVLFCPSARKTTDAGANCTDEQRGLLLKNDEMESTSDTTVRTLTAGTWVISSAVNPSDPLDFRNGFDHARVQTTALIRDASALAPQIQ